MEEGRIGTGQREREEWPQKQSIRNIDKNRNKYGRRRKQRQRERGTERSAKTAKQW